MNPHELVLVIPRQQFEERCPGALSGFFPLRGVDPENGPLGHFLSSGNFFIARSEAEEDPSFKQLIPYMLIRCGMDFLVYRRGKGGGEARLHEQWSLGFGGHVNPVEGLSGFDAYLCNAARELKEELSLEGIPLQSTVIGLVNDEENAVGQVHLGVVHIVDIDPSDEAGKLKLLSSGEDQHEARRWMRVEDLISKEAPNLETWSAMVVEAIGRDFKKAALKAHGYGGIDPSRHERFLLLIEAAANVQAQALNALKFGFDKEEQAALEEALGAFVWANSGLVANGDLREHEITKAVTAAHREHAPHLLHNEPGAKA